MKKTIMAIFLALASLASGGARASLDFGAVSSVDITPENVRDALDFLLNNTVNFSSINLSRFFDPQGQPSAPALGNTFVVNGFATVDPLPQFQGLEFSLIYDIAGTVVGGDPSTRSLFIDHGLEMAGVSNKLVLYVDDTTDADEDNAASYTDGAVLATLEVYPSSDRGILTPTGGEDHVTFRLSDYDRDRFNLPEDFFVELSSEMELGLFEFGAFGSACVPALGNCLRESGTLRFYMAPMPTPVPASLYLFLLGAGLLPWRRRNDKR